MLCRFCGKDITPLVLVNGNWACPNCKALIAKDLAVSKRGLEYAHSSEISLLKALEIAGNTDISNPEKDYHRFINRAINEAKKSSNLFEPLGYYMMAFLIDYGYIDKDLTQVERSKMATPYYYSICFSEYDKIDFKDNDLKNVYISEYEKLQEKAANSFFEMLKNLTNEEVMNFGIKEYNDYIRMLNQKYKLGGFEIEEVEINVLDIYYELIESTTKVPALAFLRINNKDYKTVFSTDNVNFKKWSYSIYRISKDNDSIAFESQSIKDNKRIDVCFGDLSGHDFGLLMINKSIKSNDKKVKKFIKYLSNTDNKDDYDRIIASFYKKYLDKNSSRLYKKPYYIFYENDIIFESNLEKLLELLIG